MIPPAHAHTAPPSRQPDAGPRLLGRVDGPPDGPVLVVVGGIHGNEPAGPASLRRVLATIERETVALRGTLVAFAGNVSGLAAKKRYLAHDLNRLWLEDRIGALRRRQATGGALDNEDREQLELLAALEAVRAETTLPVHVLDLHTTSGGGFPFANMSDTLRNRQFAAGFPVPTIVGLEEALEGTMLDYLESHGWITYAFEGGQHDDPTSVDHAEAAVWIALEGAGLLPESERHRAASARKLLALRVAGLPRFLELVHRHAIKPGDDYVMEPGFASFQPVRRGQLLAHDRHGEVRAPQSGRLLMPLYQALGDDGYFLIREFSPFWMGVSAFLRRLHVDRHATLLPGVHPVPGHPEMVAVDRSVARFAAVQVFRLLGYRRQRQSGDTLVLSRRREQVPGVE